MGCVTPLGLGVPSVWHRLLTGHSGIVSLKDRIHPETQLPYTSTSQVAALVPKGPQGFDSSSLFSKSDQRLISPFAQYALVAASEALQDAKWINLTYDQKDETGVCVGSGIGSLDDILLASTTLLKHGPRKINPYLVPRILVNMAAGMTLFMRSYFN